MSTLTTDPVLAEVQELPISSMEEADNVLRMLAYVQRRQEQIVLETQHSIDELKRQATEASEPYAEAEKVLTAQLKKFVKAARKQITVDGRRTIALPFGTIGFRMLPPSLKINKGFTEEDVIRLLRANLPKEADLYIQVRESLRKEELKQCLNELSLERIGCSLDQKEQIVIEPAKEKLSPAAKEVA